MVGTPGVSTQEVAGGQGCPQIGGKSSVAWATQDLVSETKQDKINSKHNNKDYDNNNNNNNIGFYHLL